MSYFGGWWGRTTVSQLQSEMSGTTSVFGREKGISVSFKGDKASTAPGQVTFPAMPATTPLDDQTVKLFRGWVDTESALARYSDTKFIAKQEKALGEDNPMLLDLFKQVEVSRVENEYTNFYVGAGKNLAQLSKDAVGIAVRKYKEDDHFYPTAIAASARSRRNGAMMDGALWRLEKHVDLDKVSEWVDEIETLETPQDSMALAQRIIEVIENEKEDDDDEQDGDGQGGGGAGDEDGKDESKPYSAIGNDELVDAGVPSGYAPKVMGGKLEHYTVLSTDHDEIHHFTDGWTKNIDKYTETRDEFGPSLAVAKKRLELLIQSTQKIAWDCHKERGRLDSKRLVAAYQADPYVFKVKDDDTDLNTAVSISVDLSGSMGGQKAEDAMKTAIVLSELLDRIGVPFEITGFDCTMPPEFVENVIKTDPLYDGSIYATYNEYARSGVLRHHIFKKFGDRTFDARQYFWRIGALEGSGENNSDGESIANAARSLLQRPEKRKIMFVLSDGSPHSWGDFDMQKKHLKSVITDLSKHIDIMGIGICDSNVSRYYPKYIVLDNSEDLPKKMLDLLSERFLEKRTKVEREAA